jgi:FHS family L-fucose permease-like MFS transporter
MIIGLVIMAFGALLFIPAAMSVNYLFFLIALFVLGTGLTILQTASNPYVIFWDQEKVQQAHCCDGLNQ